MKNVYDIVKGESATIDAYLEISDGLNVVPYTLNDFESATAYFEGDETTVEIEGSLQSADLGHVRFELSPDDTKLIAECESRGYFEVKTVKDGETKIFKFEESITVTSPKLVPSED